MSYGTKRWSCGYLCGLCAGCAVGLLAGGASNVNLFLVGLAVMFFFADGLIDSPNHQHPPDAPQ